MSSMKLMNWWASTGFLPCEDHHQVVVDHALAVGREPVGQHLGLLALGQVVLRVDDVARPHLTHAVLAAGQVGVLRDGDLGTGLRLHVDHLLAWIFARSADFVRVDVGDAFAQGHHRHGRVPVVDDRQMLRVLRVPEHVVGVGHRADVRGDLVVPPADAGGVDGVGHGVAPLAVVPGVGERRPDVRDVRDVGVVQRPDQLGRHHLGDLVIAREVDVEAAPCPSRILVSASSVSLNVETVTLTS